MFSSGILARTRHAPIHALGVYGRVVRARRSHRADGLAVELWPISRPKPYGKNPQQITDKAIGKVAKSIQEFGFRQPIVCDGSDVIIAGHKRLLAARKLGLRQVPVTIADDLTPAQVKAYRLADNRTSEESEWDNDLLADEIADLEALGMDLDLTGFDGFELAALRDPTPPGAALDEVFQVNYFSILDARKRRWKRRRDAWLELGVDVELADAKTG